MSAPCGGCPPHCRSCVFGTTARKEVALSQVLLSKEDYGCIRLDGGPVVLNDGTLGMMRGENFHPVTAEGAAFLHKTSNPLSAYC